MHVYADDTIIYSHANSIEQAVQQKAFQSLQMDLNAKKSKCTLFLKACLQLLDTFTNFQLMVDQFLTSRFQLTNPVSLLCLVSQCKPCSEQILRKLHFHTHNLQRDFKIRHIYI